MSEFLFRSAHLCRPRLNRKWTVIAEHRQSQKLVDGWLAGSHLARKMRMVGVGL